ncbi:MAG TPA: DUF1634 domain-containing protein [Euryarchaeota archaeon]|nr:DUF1634 domain-containing protein [Euryarchaeota archaeon]
MRLENMAYRGFTLGLIVSLFILTAGFILAYVDPSSSLTAMLFYAGIMVLIVTPATVIASLLLIFVKNGEKYMALITFIVIVVIIISGLLKKG